MTKKRILATAALLWLTLSSGAQQSIYVCTTTGCDAFNTALMPTAHFSADSISVGRIAYQLQQIDSIVFHRPSGEVQKLGWWGSMTDGTATYRARLEQPGYQYDVCFTFHVEAGLCTSAACEVSFAEEWMMKEFLHSEAMATNTDDSYIYVKATQTGPRRFEVWVMGNPVLPEGGEWLMSDDGLTLTKDCGEWLADRPMQEVRQIVETWVHQQATRIDLLDDDDEQN